MQKNSFKSVPSKKFLETAARSKSFHAVARNGWIIKFSTLDDTKILLTVISQYTGQAIIRYFGNEDDACLFINFIQELDAEQLIEL